MGPVSPLGLVSTLQGVPKKSIPFEKKPLLEVNAFITMLNPRVCYFSIVIRHSNSNKVLISKGILFTHPWVQHSNKAFTSNKGFISKGILFLGTPCILLCKNYYCSWSCKASTGCPKKSIPFEMKPLLEVNALLLCWTHGCVKRYTFWNQASVWIWMPYYYAEVTHPWVQHSNKGFTSNKGFISKGVLFFGTPCIGRECSVIISLSL